MKSTDHPSKQHRSEGSEAHAEENPAAKQDPDNLQKL